MKRKNLIWLVTLVFLIILGVIIYIHFWNRSAYTKEMQAYTNAFNTNNYSDSIVSAQKTLSEASTGTQEGTAKLALGLSYWLRNQPGDLTQAIKIFKEVAGDSSLPASLRSSSLNYIAEIVILNNTQFYNQYFPEAGYQKYLLDQDGKSSPSIAYFNFLSSAENLYPNSFSEYALAGGWYARQITYGLTNATTTEKVRDTIKRYLELGYTKTDQDTYTPVAAAQTALYRALALDAISTSSDKKSLQDTEAAYDDALAKVGFPELQANSLVQNMMLLVRYDYASFLLNDPAQKDKINTLLKPFADVDTTDSHKIAYFKYLKYVAPKDFFRKIALTQLSKISSEFRAFLVKI